MAETLRKRRGGGGDALSAPLLQAEFDDGGRGGSEDEDEDGRPPDYYSYGDGGEDEPLVERAAPQGAGDGVLSGIVHALVASWGYVLAALTQPLRLAASVAQCLIGHTPLAAHAPLALNPDQEEQLEVLRERIATRFDVSCQEHQDGLWRLWALGFPGEQLSGLKSPQWKEMGWQGNDPSTDFRGAGYLALENLIYFAESYPAAFKDLMKKVNGQRSEWEYPFCVAGVNLTFTLIDILDMHAPGRLPNSPAGKHFLMTFDDYDRAFQEIYCAGMELLDIIWLEMRASYMDFPAVMKSVKEKLTHAITHAQSLSMVRVMLLGDSR